jgi:hypothetical protein
MPLATRTIANTIEWAKRLSFNRNPVIGNSLEPALTSANLVAQMILSPPFEWWWNNQELVFTCNPTPNSATSTSSTVTGGILTVTASNTFAAGNIVMLGTATAPYTGVLAGLSGQVMVILTATGSSFTGTVQFANAGPDTSSAVITNITTQDYTIPAPSFSHIEHASVLDLVQVPQSNPPVYNPAKWWELTIKNSLALETVKARPTFISPHVEDGNGNMSFRLSAAPDKPYPVSIHVQLVAPTFTSINQTWAPIPDFMQHIYDWGFLALMWQFADDPRASYANSQFKAALLGRAEGLTEEQKNIFLNNWENLQSGYLMKMQQGIQARSQ